MTKIFGIDTNHHHPITDWKKVKDFLYEKNSKTNPGFVMVRLGYSATGGHGGLCLDRIALDSLKQCNALGIPVGVYVYSYDKSAEAAVKTMNEAMNVIKDYSIDYPVVYDIEYEPFNKVCGRATNSIIATSAMQLIEKAGYYGMIYASRDFFKNYMNLGVLKDYDKWEAAYTGSDDNSVANGIWQFTSKGSVPGITGNVDFNYAYKDYKSIIENAKLNNKKLTTLYDIAVTNISDGDVRKFQDLANDLSLVCTVVKK